MKACIGAVLVLAMGLTVGCSDNEDEPSLIDEIVDPNCADICDTFDACVRDIDVGNCVDQCDNATEVYWTECVQVPEMTLGGPIPPGGTVPPGGTIPPGGPGY